MTEAAAAEPFTPRDPKEYLVPDWRKAPGFKPWVSPCKPWEACSDKRQALLRKVWAKGDLSYKLDPEQLKVYRHLRAWLDGEERSRRYVLDVSRRWGKSSIMFLIAVEERIRHGQRKRMAYWTDTGRMVEEIILLEVFPWLFEDCPPEMRPQWFPSRHRIIWDRDAKSLDQCRSLELAGLDDPNRARGRSLFRGFVDEAAFIPDLDYILRSVISKMMLTEPDSALLLGSTPPITPTHVWTTDVVPIARAEGAYHHGTIYDNPRLSDEQIAAEIEETGGPHHSATRRELYAEHIVDETMAILPEAAESVRAGTLVSDAKPPEHRYCYVAMDPGWSDMTGVLFAYVDFESQRLHVEGEWLEAQATSGRIADMIHQQEKTLWGESVRYWSRRDGGGLGHNPYRRWTDIDHRLIADLSHDHDIRFHPTLKDNLDQQIVRVRNMILDKRLVIHPRCNKLIEQMQHGVYANELRRKFARNGAFGHFDLLAALVYLVRNVEPLIRRNPRPPGLYGVDLSQMHAPKESDVETPKRKQQQAGRQRARIGRLRGRKGTRGTHRY